MMLVYLLLGSNVGDRVGNICRAIALIAQQIGHVSQQSSIYETEPWGGVEQSPFLNQAIAVLVPLAPLELLRQLKTIEKAVGRVETVTWGPRVIDIDIMLMGDLILQVTELVIPQRRLENRRFALTPLAEIAPEMVHPVLQATINRLLTDCQDTMWVRKWNYT